MKLRPTLIRKLRERFNFTQTALAAEAKVSLATIVKIERGHIPTLSVLSAIADVFHIDYRDLFVPPPKAPSNDAICKLIIEALSK